MNFNDAVRKLREEVGESQQAFATRLGISINGLRNYEQDRSPGIMLLARLQKLAQDRNVPATVQEAITREFHQELKRHEFDGVVSFGVGKDGEGGGLIFVAIKDSTEHRFAYSFWQTLIAHRKGAKHATAVLRDFYKGVVAHQLLTPVEQNSLEYMAAIETNLKTAGNQP